MKTLIPGALMGAWSLFLKQELSIRIASAVFVVLLVALGVIVVLPKQQAETVSQAQTTISLATQTVGSETAAFSTASSWPGEIISPNDADVQPPREGAIVSWDVSIGDYVSAGQVLGRLSATSLTPELATTLADQAAALAQAKARAASTDTYVGQTKTQLSTFTTSDTALRAIEEAKQFVIATKGECSSHTATVHRLGVFGVFWKQSRYSIVDKLSLGTEYSLLVRCYKF